MPYDASLVLTGTSGSEITTIATNTNGTAVFVGKNRIIHADLRVTATPGGTNPSLTLAIQESTTASGTAFSTVAAFEAVTASMVATTGGGSDPQMVTFRTTKDYVRFTATVSTTATFSKVEVRLRPTGEPAISGGFPSS